MNGDITALNEKISLATEITPDVIDAMNNLAQLQFESSPEEGYQVAQRALQYARSIRYLQGEAQALVHCGLSAMKLRNYAGANTLFEQALAIREKLQDREGVADVHAKLGNVHLYDGNYSEALEHYGRAIEIRMVLNDELGTADLYTNSGIIHGLQGNYALALKSHMQALRTYERLNNLARVANSSSNIGLLYLEQQNYDEALRMFQRALDIRQQENDSKAMSTLLNNIGNVYQEQKRFPDALEVHQRVLKLREQSGDRAKMATTYSNLGNVYKELGEPKRALDFYIRSLALFEEMHDKRGLVQAYTNLGELYFEQKNYPDAHRYLNDAIKLAEEMGLKNPLRKAYEYLASVFAIENNYEKAYENHLRYTQLDKEISNAEISGQMAQMTLRYEIEQKDRDAEMERVKNAELKKAYNSLESEQKRSEELLLNILPAEVSEELKQSGKTRARSFDMVTVMFADIQGFTKISEQLSAEELVSGLDEYFEEFDKIIETQGIEKIKTIGDAYLCAGGIPVAMKDHAEKTVATAIEFLDATVRLKIKRAKENKHIFNFRIGIHSGPLVAGVVGIKKFAYDIWGDTVNTASRMQQNSEPNRINISHSTYELIKDKFGCEFRGEIEAKNKGRLRMYFVKR